MIYIFAVAVCVLVLIIVVIASVAGICYGVSALYRCASRWVDRSERRREGRKAVPGEDATELTVSASSGVGRRGKDDVGA